MKYDTLLFDLDGTLLDTLDDLTDSVNQVLLSHGFPQRSKGEIRSFLGNGALELIRLSLPEEIQKKEEETSPSPYSSYIKEFQNFYQVNMDKNTKPYEGIIEFLHFLNEKNFKLAIVSNKYDLAVKDLSKKYFGQIFPVATGETESIKRKPAPDTLLKAIEDLGSSPGRAILIGDSEVDIEAAKNANIPCVCVSWGFRDKDQLEKAGADYIIDKVEEIMGIIS